MNKPRIFPKSIKQRSQISKHENSANFFISVCIKTINHLKTSPTLLTNVNRQR